MSTLVTNEPTHTVDGVEKPGPVDLRDNVTLEKTLEADAVSADFYEDAPKRNRYSASNPQIAEPYADLQTLSYKALLEYGEMNPGTLDGDTSLLFLGFGNKIIEDMRAHPYYEMPDIDYYIATTDIRPVPDILIIAGLQYYYALQQASEKAQLKSPEYFSRLNSVMYNRKYGNGKIEVQPFR